MYNNNINNNNSISCIYIYTTNNNRSLVKNSKIYILNYVHLYIKLVLFKIQIITMLNKK